MNYSSMYAGKVPSVVVRDLRHVYGTGETATEVLKGIRADLYPGEIVMLVGASGCGKTTLLTLLGGLRSVQSGSALVLGREMAGLSGEELVLARRRIGFIFQAHNLFESLTALENVRLAMELHGEATPERLFEARGLLAHLGLDGKFANKPDQLSGGQRQRVAIARALVNRPQLILADEPTAALDEKSSDTVIDLIRRRTERDGATALVVTHDTRIRDAADRIITMSKGSIVSNVLVRESLRLCGYLKKSGLFPAATPEEISRLAEGMTPQVFGPGEVITRQGEVAERFYVVWDGRVEIVTDMGTPEQKVEGVLETGGHFGERALMRSEPRHATVRALEETEVYGLDAATFRRATSSIATFVEQIRHIYSLG